MFLILMTLLIPLGSMADCETPWGISIPDGVDVQAFSREHVDSGEKCEDFSETRECQGYSLSGNEEYKFEMCDGFKSCTNNQFGEIQHGETVTFYKEDVTPPGIKCQKEARTCNNGALTGTNKFTSCQQEK